MRPSPQRLRTVRSQNLGSPALIAPTPQQSPQARSAPRRKLRNARAVPLSIRAAQRLSEAPGASLASHTHHTIQNGLVLLSAGISTAPASVDCPSQPCTTSPLNRYAGGTAAPAPAQQHLPCADVLPGHQNIALANPCRPDRRRAEAPNCGQSAVKSSRPRADTPTSAAIASASDRPPAPSASPRLARIEASRPTTSCILADHQQPDRRPPPGPRTPRLPRSRGTVSPAPPRVARHRLAPRTSIHRLRRPLPPVVRSPCRSLRCAAERTAVRPPPVSRCAPVRSLCSRIDPRTALH